MLSRINEALTWLVARYEREDGQALAEYGLLLALIAVVCIVALTAQNVGNRWLLSTTEIALGWRRKAVTPALSYQRPRLDRRPDGRDGPE